MENKYSKPNTTRKKVKLLGTKEFIDARTGEKETMKVTNIEERDANFHKIWKGHMIESNDMKGNQKIRIEMYIIKKNKKEKKIKKKSNLLSKIRNGYYRVNPDVIFKGGRNDRMNVLLRYSKGE